MRRIALALVVAVAVTAPGCSLFQSKGDLDRASVERVEKNFGRVAEKYVLYVDADGRLSDAEKDDERKYVEATARLIASMKNRIGKED